jgi:hypothetical protein
MLKLSLRWRFFVPAVFLACRDGLGKRRNIPSGETAAVRHGRKHSFAFSRRDSPEVCK